MKEHSNIVKIDSWIVAIFIAETSICSTIDAFISIPFISVILMLLLLMVILVKHKNIIRINSKCLILYAGFFFTLIISIQRNGYLYVKNYLVYFIVFGITSLILMSLKIDYKNIFTDIIIIYAVVILVYFVKSRRSFLDSDSYWSSQMGVAYAFVIPVFFAFAYLFFRKKLFSDLPKMFYYASLFELSASLYIILFDCGTRGAIVTVLFGCGLIVIGSTDNIKAIAIIFFCHYCRDISFLPDGFSYSMDWEQFF